MAFFVQKILYFLIISAVIYLSLALILIASQRGAPYEPRQSLEFDGVQNVQAAEVELKHYTARDGAKLGVRHYRGDPSRPLVIVVHGSGWHGGGYVHLGEALHRQLGAEVLIPDLRGHGPAPLRRGDIDYIGQFEDDLADLIRTYGAKGRDVHLVGHSSGGGLVIRFAGGAYGAMLSKAVLIAPYLHHGAPTMRKDAGGWSRVLIRRIIGLSMLNTIGITGLNRLHIVQFQFPKSVLDGDQGHTATQSYSYRLNTSFAPRNDFNSDIAQLPEFLLIVGEDDDAFLPMAYAPMMEDVTSSGVYQVIQGTNHLGILNAPPAHDAMVEFVR